MISHGARSASRSGTRSRWTSTPIPSRAISDSDDASPAAPQSCSETTSPCSTRSSDTSISALPRNGIADLNGRALLVRALEILRSEHRGATDTVAPGQRPVEDERVADALRLRGEDAFGRQEADAHRVHERICRVRLVEDALAADRRHADAVAVVADAGDRAFEVPVGRPKRRPSSSAIGRAPIATMSRRIPPTPVAAPWKGSTADGWLCDSALNATATPAAEVDHAGVLARALQHTLAGRLGSRFSRRAECL